METQEEWIEFIKGYSVCNNGTIKSHDRIETFYNFNNTKISRMHKGKIIKPRNNGNGYMNINIGRNYRDYVHRIVANAFLSKPIGSNYVNHKNGIKNDNRVDNLEWVTASENQLHSKKTGLSKTGQYHSQAKLTNADVIFIRDNYSLGTPFLSDKFKVSKSTICKIAHGKSRKHG